jgi:hypothetical protein
MSRALDIIAIVLLCSGIVVLCAAIYTLGSGQDLSALYWLVVGGLVLRAANNLVRSKVR